MWKNQENVFSHTLTKKLLNTNHKTGPHKAVSFNSVLQLMPNVTLLHSIYNLLETTYLPTVKIKNECLTTTSNIVFSMLAPMRQVL